MKAVKRVNGKFWSYEGKIRLQENRQNLADAILSGRSESLMSLSNKELLAFLF